MDSSVCKIRKNIFTKTLEEGEKQPAAVLDLGTIPNLLIKTVGEII